MSLERTGVCLVATVLLCFVGQHAEVHAKPSYEQALRKYQRWLKRPALSKRTDGREALAATQDLRGLEVLAASYPGAEEPKEEVQETLVAMCCDFFRSEEAVPVFRKWRLANKQRRDAWLWYRGLGVELEFGDGGAADKAIKDKGFLFLRAAAIRAKIADRDRSVLELIPKWIEALMASEAPELERVLMLEAMARALPEFDLVLETEPWKNAALALLKTFESEKTPKRTRLTIVRNLSAALGVPIADVNQTRWVREVLAGGADKGNREDRYATPRPVFAGLRGTGTRIAYVIDLSDSMLKPVSPEDIKRLKPPPAITGRRTKPKRKPRPEDQIPWDKIKTRFDLARELLKASLRGLPKGTFFSVIWFGTVARPLKTTRSLMETNKKNVKKAIKELDAITPGPPGTGEWPTESPYGALRGETNMHGGLVRAFERTNGKRLSAYGYVAEKGLAEGCDTIFVLSDGNPTLDDFQTVDTRDPDDHAVKDRETLEKTEDTPELNFPGPYADDESVYFFDDIERRNLFRQVEIHCVGIGEAQMGLLGRLADIGLGEARRLGEED